MQKEMDALRMENTRLRMRIVIEGVTDKVDSARESPSLLGFHVTHH